MPLRRLSAILAVGALGLCLISAPLHADDTPAAATPAPVPTLPPLPAPMGVPMPGPKTDAPYAPQPILPGGVVIPLYPADSPYLNKDKVREPEKYIFWGPGEIGAIVNI